MDQLPTAMMGFGLGLLTASLLGPGISAAIAQDEAPKPVSLKMRVYPSLDAPDNAFDGGCPKEVTVISRSSPYREGGYDAFGEAQLSSIAGPARFEASDRFSTTWRAQLKPQYRSCIATAGLVDEDNSPDPSFMSMRFENGYVDFILNMSGYSDVNGYTLNIIYQNIEAGNPVWRWGGTD